MATKIQSSISPSSSAKLVYPTSRNHSQIVDNEEGSFFSSHLINNQSSYCKTESTSRNSTNFESNYINRILSTDLKPFQLNDLVWAKLKNFPWWPCQIVRDLIAENEFCKIIGTKQMYLVEMIGSYKERAWVSRISLFSYKGFESFKTYAQDQVDRAATKLDKERLAERFQLKVALNRRDEWEQAIAKADLIIRNRENNKKQNTSSFVQLKRKRENNTDNNIQTNDETNKIKKFSKNQNENHKLHSIESIRHENIHKKSDNDPTHESDEEDEEDEEEETTSDEEDPALFQPTSIYDYEKPIQNIYTYQSMNGQKSNVLNVNYTDDEQPLQSIDSIVAEIENIKQKNDNDNRDSMSKIAWSSATSSPSSITSSSSLPKTKGLKNSKLENQQQIFKEIYHDQTKMNAVSLPEQKKKRGRKPKLVESDKKCLSESSSPLSSEYSSPSNSRKNSADLSAVKHAKKLKKSTLSDCVIGNHPAKKTEKKRSISTSDNNSTTFNESLFNENKDFDLNADSADYSSNTIKALKSNENSGGIHSAAETYLIDRYKYAVRHIRQGLSVEEACNKYRISKGALLKCLSGGTAPRGKKTRLTETEENEIVEWLINNKDVKYNEAIHLVFEQVEQIFQQTQRPNPFNNGKPSMDWWYDFLSRHPQIMASKPDWLRRGKVNDQYIRDVQSGQLKCTKFRRALLSAIQYIRSLADSENNLPDTNDNSVFTKQLCKKETLITQTPLNNKPVKQKQKLASQLKVIPTKTSVVSSHLNQNNQVKQRQTMNSISTSIDLVKHKTKQSEFINNNVNRSWLNTKTDNTKTMIENTNLVEYNDDDLDAFSLLNKQTFENNTNTVRFDNFLSNTSHQNCLNDEQERDNYHHSLNGSNLANFMYDNHNVENYLKHSSSIYLNDNFNVSIPDDDDEEDKDSTMTPDPNDDESHLMAPDSHFV